MGSREKRTGTIAGVWCAILLLSACSQGKAPAFAESLRGVEDAQAVALSRNHIDSLARHDPERLVPEIRAIVAALDAYGDRRAATAIATYPYGIDPETNPEIAARLLTSTLLPGTPAPEIKGLAPARVRPEFTVLLFHESACRTCGDIIWELKNQFPNLVNAGVKVITISTDTDPQVWTEYAAGLPWPDKLCDYRGFHSPPMIAYGVAATPMLFLINRAGTVVDQYATFAEIWEVISNGKP